MTEELKERPAVLKRRPRPAPDESVDPVDYTTAAPAIVPAALVQTVPQEVQTAPEHGGVEAVHVLEPAPEAVPVRQSVPEATAQLAPRAAPAPKAAAKAGTPSRSSRRELVFPLSTRLSQEVLDLLYTAVDEEGISVREAVEQAIRLRWGTH